MKLNVGVSRKLGLPAYSSVGASCHLEVEIDPETLAEPGDFRARVRAAFVAAERAVDEELARLQAGPGPDEPTEVKPSNGHRRDDQVVVAPTPKPENRPAGPTRPATPGQVRAIVAIARRRHADLDGLLCDLGVTRPDDLSLAAASRLIDQLKAEGDA